MGQRGRRGRGMKGRKGESVRQWETGRDRSASRLGEEDMQNREEILLQERERDVLHSFRGVHFSEAKTALVTEVHPKV